MASLIFITVQNSSVIMGGSIALHATGMYSDGSRQDITSQVVWTKISETPNASQTGMTLATLNSSGVVQTPTASPAVNGGSAVIRASLGGLTNTLTLTITPLTITELSFVTSPLVFPYTQILPQAQVLATFNDGSQAVNNNNSLFPITWTSSDPTTVSFIDNRGTMHFLKSGSATLTAAYQSIQATVPLTINPVLLGISISGPAKGYVGQTSQLSLLAQYNDGTSVDVSSQALWVTSNGQFAPITQEGLVTASTPGTVVVTATYDEVTTSFHYTVPALVSTKIVAPASATAGQVVQFSLLQTYSDGSVVDATSQANWFSANTSIGTIDNTGLFTCVSPGVVQVGQYQTGQTVQSVSYTVLPTAILSLSITAPSPSLAAGSTAQLIALATYTDGTQGDLTSQVTWNAANPAAAVSSTGLVTGQTAGLAVVVANYQSIQGSITLNIFPAQDENLIPQFRSHLTQGMLNYFDESDVRVREQKYTLDAQLLNIAAQQLELSDTRFNREINSTKLDHCPANIDNKGVYWQQPLGPGFDFTVDHIVQGQIGSGLTTLTPYDDILPIPTRVTADGRFTPVSLTSPTLFSVSGIGIVASQAWATQRVSNVTPALTGRLVFELAAAGFNQVNVQIRITGQRAPQPAWASRRSTTSETLTMTQIGLLTSKFAWAVINEIQISNLPVGATLSGQVGTFGLNQVLDPARPYIDPTRRDVRFARYWSYDSGLLKEEFLASNYQGFRYVQSYATSPINAIAVEPNTYGMFVAQGTTLVYVDRREPMPLNLNATALTTEPYYGLDVSIDETHTGPLRYVVLRPVQYAQYASVNQYRYVIKTPQGSTYVLTPDGVLAVYSTTAGWRRGAPITLTIPLAQIGTYVITLQCVGSDNTVVSDAVPYPNFALTPLAQFDLSSVVPSISGLSFDDRGRLWVWSGDFALPLTFQYDAYLLDANTQSIYLTDQVQGLVIDGAAV